MTKKELDAIRKRCEAVNASTPPTELAMLAIRWMAEIPALLDEVARLRVDKEEVERICHSFAGRGVLPGHDTNDRVDMVKCVSCRGVTKLTMGDQKYCTSADCPRGLWRKYQGDI